MLVETLVAFGVRHVFGMVGHSNLGFADALRRAEDCGEITHIGIRHEGAASFAASAYGKLTGRPGGVPHADDLDPAMKELFASDGPAQLCNDQDAELL